MAVLKVRKYGDPALRQSAEPVGEVTPEVRAVIADMTETMYDEVGIGLAAPQVGIPLRLIVISAEDGRSVQALLNPAIVDRGGEVTAPPRRAACRFRASSLRSRARRGSRSRPARSTASR
jgi:peptide deformylase